MSKLTKVQAVTARHALLWVAQEAQELRTIALLIEEGNLPEWRAEAKSDDLKRRIGGMIYRLKMMLDTDMRTP